MKTLEQFIEDTKGKAVDFDGVYGAQCMDLIEYYNKDVVGAARLGGNAADLARNPRPNAYEYKTNTPWYVPPRGAIAVWNTKMGAGYGHTAIVLSAGLMKFMSLDQNWVTGSPVQETEHTYSNVAGFLVPRPMDLIIVYNGMIDEIRTLANKYPKV